MHSVEADPEYVPMAQGRHGVAEDRSLSYCPIEQSVHSVEPAAANCPTSQLMHAVASSSEYCPALHRSHELAPSVA